MEGEKIMIRSFLMHSILLLCAANFSFADRWDLRCGIEKLTDEISKSAVNAYSCSSNDKTGRKKVDYVVAFSGHKVKVAGYRDIDRLWSCFGNATDTDGNGRASRGVMQRGVRVSHRSASRAGRAGYRPCNDDAPRRRSG